ncbi:hypothetical protein ACIBK9_01725 [Nonomuraea sp. NPDC050227]|uniref:hypothetical protein n=1 Tax=Nonomuraea sp. NPDC050227 TaxID=3364360 RepID=UPI0037B9C25E
MEVFQIDNGAIAIVQASGPDYPRVLTDDLRYPGTDDENGDARTGESPGGRYFWCSDLIIVRDVGYEGMAAAIRDLISSGEIDTACGLLGPPTDDKNE